MVAVRLVTLEVLRPLLDNGNVRRHLDWELLRSKVSNGTSRRRFEDLGRAVVQVGISRFEIGEKHTRIVEAAVTTADRKVSTVLVVVVVAGALT